MMLFGAGLMRRGWLRGSYLPGDYRQQARVADSDFIGYPIARCGAAMASALGLPLERLFTASAT